MKSNFVIETRGSTHIVLLGGTVDLEQADGISSALRKIVAEGASEFVVDLTDVDLITSDGLRVLLELRHRVIKRDGFVRLVCPNPLLYEIFSTTKLDQIFPIFSSRDEALA